MWAKAPDELITKTDIFGENKLFGANSDSTVRKVF